MTTSRWVQQPLKGKSKAYIGHRGGKIFIAVLGYEPDLTKLILRYTGRDDPVWRDDCAELIFDPGNTEKDYYQFGVNAIGSMADIYNGDGSKNFKCRHKGNVFRDRGYGAIEFAVDGKDLDHHPIEPGAIWSLNVFRVRIGAASEHGGIWPTFGWTQRLNVYPFAIFK